MESGTFSTEWKIANVVPIHKGDDKRNVRNSPPFLFSQFLEKYLNLLYRMKCTHFFLSKTIQYLQINQVLSKEVLVFLYWSLVLLFLSIRHEIYQSLALGFEVRGAFLDIPKRGDNV